ncbi:hypothetical protein CDAR_201861 [Caerostris darwini]|uniref:Uncharacterized protein n=1 Tax=Caerostris darwini TaxID=1538125 RepID=A0AAV4WRN0_9ARAC|nr:hypothetical protein CDAR_201861 [Caerostris darwini]
MFFPCLHKFNSSIPLQRGPNSPAGDPEWYKSQFVHTCFEEPKFVALGPWNGNEVSCNRRGTERSSLRDVKLLETKR